MRFLALFAASVAFAETVKRQDATGGIDAILSAVTGISNSTQHLTELITAYTGPTQAGDILLAVQQILDSVGSADEVVKATPGPLNINNASSLIAPVTDLKNNVTASIDATIAKQQLFYSVGLGLEVKIQLQDIQAAALPLTDDLTAIVPDTLQSVAQELAQPIKDDLQRGIDAYANATGDYPDSGATSASANIAIVAIAAAGLAFFAL